VQVTERHREKDVIKRRLATLADSQPLVCGFIEENLTLLNGKVEDPHSFDQLDALLDDQAYRLAFWRVAADEINYRRFFDINELAALSMERAEVFAATHELVLRLLTERKITGLRIDHPDGLYNPQQYLQRLQQHYVLECARALFTAEPAYRDVPWEEVEKPLLQEIIKESQQESASPLRRPLYVVVEKILGTGEPLPDNWPVYGMTGYEFLKAVNGLFVDHNQDAACSRIYQRWTRSNTAFRDLVYQKKFLILQVSLAGEMHMLGHQLDRLAQKHRWSRDFTMNSLRHALRQVIACFPVYRSYISEAGIPRKDANAIIRAVVRAKRRNPALSASIFDYIRDMLLMRYQEAADEQERAEQLRFAGKFQQVTAPVMAKGLEDTVFYVYNRLLSLNEVGGDPEQFGLSVPDFHRLNSERQRDWPWSLSALSTHDTKRSEDVRARLNVLSELPHEWQVCLSRWKALNQDNLVPVEEEETTVPDRNMACFIYQTLLGAWPPEPYTPEDFADFVSRIQAYVQKAIHEAKEHTSWINPNPTYDEAMRQFVDRLLDEEGNRKFLDDFRNFQRRISHYGMFNSLAQTLLKIASPGVPDTYQGTELWDFSLVDPDNRRPVNYDLRQTQLRQLQKRAEGTDADLPRLCRELTSRKEDGRIKLYLTYRSLHCRRDHRGLFARGEYLPVEAQGPRQENVCAFVRVHEDQCALTVVPRLVTKLMAKVGDVPLGKAVWQDTALVLPEKVLDRKLCNVFTGEVYGARELMLAEVFGNFPVALLLAQN
jgi:(1->4)-alpha-D-glucan 1-alpha-D-glucosylmutase